MKCCESTECERCVGVEIDEERVDNTRNVMYNERKISPEQCNIICGNALEQNYSEATSIFLYLTERGLRLIFPIIRDQIKHPFNIVT